MYCQDIIFIFADGPEEASISGESSVVAGNDITLICSCNDLGNPEGIYNWVRPSGGTPTGNTLQIADTNVERDDGEYECYVANDIGNGQSAKHTLTVNSKL